MSPGIGDHENAERRVNACCWLIGELRQKAREIQCEPAIEPLRTASQAPKSCEVSASRGCAAKVSWSQTGELNTPSPCSRDAETSQLWELGLRSQWLDRRLTLNLTGFLTKFANYQQQAFDPALSAFSWSPMPVTSIRTGVEFEFAYAPSERASISGGVTYLDAGYDYSTGPCYAGQTPALGCVGGRQDLRNGSFINAPDLRFTLLARYTHPLSAASEIYGQINFRWQDDVQFAYDQNPRFMQPAYGITDLTLGVDVCGGRYEASAFLKNAFDQQYVSNVVAQGAAGGGAIVNAVPRISVDSSVSSWRQDSERAAVRTAKAPE